MHIISLGSLCPIKNIIKELGLTPMERLPFDWIESRTIDDVILSLDNDFVEWYDKNSWYCIYIHKTNMCPLLTHKKLRFRFPHDFILSDAILTNLPDIDKLTDMSGYKDGIPIREDSLNRFMDCYNRRIDRFRKLAREPNIKCFVRWGFQDLSQINKLFTTLLTYCNSPFILIAVDNISHRSLETSKLVEHEYPHHPFIEPIVQTIWNPNILNELTIYIEKDLSKCYIGRSNAIGDMKHILNKFLKSC